MQRVSRKEQELGGYGARKASPIGIGGAIAVHAVVVGAFLLMPREGIDHFTPDPIWVSLVPNDPPPPPPNEAVRKKAETPQLQKPVSDSYSPPKRIDLDTGASVAGGDPVDTGALGGNGGDYVRPADPPPIAVLVDAMNDPRYARDFQPAYPPAMQRAEQEGKVTVRVRISAEGRVLAVEKLFATNDAFWDVTQAQALRKWRFRPATRDGQPVEGVRILTVHFQIER